MSVIWINKAFNIEGLTVIVNKRILNNIYAQLWLDSKDDKPTIDQISTVIGYLMDKYNTPRISLSEIVLHHTKDQPINLTNFL